MAACFAGSAVAETTYQQLDFEQLDGWEDDDHAAALSVFLNTCDDIKDPEWSNICDVAKTVTNAKGFFETLFTPVLIEDGKDALFTGYFEPELRGSLTKDDRYKYPIYSKPDDIVSGQPWLTRRQIEETAALSGKGLEIAYADDAFDVFSLQIQGSGRVKLTDGSFIRVGYGGSNGRNYSSVGKILIERGIFEAHQVSADRIRKWVRDNPIDGADLLRENASFVFFRTVNEVPADKGPLGAMNRSVTTLRTLAVDPSITKLGAPVWLEKNGRDPMRRLMVAQDTGSAIKGAQRADIFYGTGDMAGITAGAIRDPGRMIVLMPVQSAFVKMAENG